MRVPVLTYQPLTIAGRDYSTNPLVALAQDLRTLTDAGFGIRPLREVVDAWSEGREDDLRDVVAIAVDDGSDFDFRDLDHPTAGPQRSVLNALRDFQREAPGRQPRLHATSFVVASPDARAQLDRVCMLGKAWWSDDWWQAAVKSGLMHVANRSWDRNHEALPDDPGLPVQRGTFRSIDRADLAEHQVAQASRFIAARADNPGRGLFAYPYGDATPYLANTYFPRNAASIGLVAAFTDRAGYLEHGDDRWRLPRFVFGRDWQSREDLLALLADSRRPIMVASGEAISDPEDVARFKTVPRILMEWMEPFGGMKDRSVLDFGCGKGVTALAVARDSGARRVVGVDIGPDPAKCLQFAREELGMRRLPPNLRLHRVAPDALHDADDRFDFAYSWSVFEHVDQRVLPRALQNIRTSLEPGGFALIQIAPLFYSSQGSHLASAFAEPWAHLTMQHDLLRERIREGACSEEEAVALWGTYETLNRITADELLELVRAAGFEVLRVETTLEDLQVPPRLAAIYQDKVLRTNQVVILARR